MVMVVVVVIVIVIVIVVMVVIAIVVIVIIMIVIVMVVIDLGTFIRLLRVVITPLVIGWNSGYNHNNFILCVWFI